MADDLTEDEIEALRKHRAARDKQKSGRKVKVRGKSDDGSAEYEFDLEGDEAERVVSRHRALFAEQEEGDGDGDQGDGQGKGYFRGTRKAKTQARE